MQEILHNPVFFYSVVLLASFLSTSVGTGGGFILVPLAAIYFGSKESVGILTMYFLFQNTGKILLFWKHIHLSLGMKIILYSIPGALLGSYALSYIPVEIFKKLLAIFVLLYLGNELFKFIPKRGLKEKHAIPFFGFLYGFLSGLIATGNLVKGPFFAGMGLLKESYIATYAFTSFFINVPKLATYYATGIIDLSSFSKSLPFLIISIIGTLLGKMFLRQIRNDVFNWILNISFAVSAIILFFE